MSGKRRIGHTDWTKHTPISEEAGSKSQTPESERDRKDYREIESEDQHVRERWLRHMLEKIMFKKKRQKLGRQKAAAKAKRSDSPRPNRQMVPASYSTPKSIDTKSEEQHGKRRQHTSRSICKPLKKK